MTRDLDHLELCRDVVESSHDLLREGPLPKTVEALQERLDRLRDALPTPQSR